MPLTICIKIKLVSKYMGKYLLFPEIKALNWNKPKYAMNIT